MYTYNLFCYGHNMSKDPELNNQLHDFDLECSGGDYEVDFPYHGGQCLGSVYSTIMGINITDDDGNPEYVNTIRTANEEDYKEGYDAFLKKYKEVLNSYKGESKEYDAFLVKVLDFFDNNEPEFYSVEASS